MVQRNSDIEEDLKAILQTRVEMTEKLDLLKRRVRGAVLDTKFQVQHAIDDVKQTAQGVKRTLNPYYQVDQHPWAVMVGVILFGYVVGQRGRNGSRSHGNGHLFRDTGQFFYDLVKKALPWRG
jgi:ElaB/YqjD/DUF883 family membrane-anchored ribosome-binding protein